MQYVDGGLVANIPLQAALEMGDTCLPPEPRHIADILMLTFHTMLRQRSQAEAPLVARLVPLPYVTSPCPVRRRPFSFDGTPELIRIAYETARDFLDHCPIPVSGTMSDGPHFHFDHPDEIAAPEDFDPHGATP